jgi:5-methylcytosine-specific restriction endonuclease McrA
MAKLNGSKWIRPNKRQAIYTSDNHTCQYCGRSIYEHSDIVLTLDHILPRELGGDNKATNLVTACLSCNSSKRDLPLAAFIQVLADRGVDPSQVRKNVRNASRRHARLEKRGRK